MSGIHHVANGKESSVLQPCSLRAYDDEAPEHAKRMVLLLPSFGDQSQFEYATCILQFGAGQSSYRRLGSSVIATCGC